MSTGPTRIIEGVDHDPGWPVRFEAEAACLVEALGARDSPRAGHFG